MTNLWVTFSTDVSTNFTESSGNIIYYLNNNYNLNGNLVNTGSDFIIYELSNNPIQEDVLLDSDNWDELNFNSNLSPFQSYWLGGINTNLPQIFTSRSQLVTAIDNWIINPIPIANNYGLIENWNVENVTDMNYIFNGATSFNSNISNWNVRNVTSMNFMFYEATSFNSNISNWNVGNVTLMGFMFNRANTFNQDLSNWDVGNVIAMNSMFSLATSFNGNISNWDVRNITSMDSMFSGATSFNGNISNWDVRNVRSMNSVFFRATSFNNNISNWNVGNVIAMNYMFSGANTFNQDISNWDVGNVMYMYRMFDGATSFNQDISNWDVGNVSNDNLLEMFKNVTFFTDMNKLIYSNGTPFNYFISQRTSNILNIDGYYYYTVVNYITNEYTFYNDSALNSITPSSSYIFIILSKTEITDPHILKTADIHILTLNPTTPIKFNNYIELSNNFNVDTYYYVYTTDNAIANTLQDSHIQESLQLQFLP